MKTVDFSETIAACDLKVGRCRQLIEVIRYVRIEGHGHFVTIYFPCFVCFVLYLDKISGERLQDLLSSCCVCESKDAVQLRGNHEADERLCFRYMDSTTPSTF